MSFLRINGYTVPVSSCEEKIIEVGSRSNGLDGSPLIDRLRTRRAWDCATPPLQREIATAVKALVLGEGVRIPFASDDYTSKGLAPESGAVRTLRSAAADGDPVDNEYHFTGSVAVEPATVNLLPADSRDAENAPTGFTALNSAAIAADTVNFWQGTKSIKVITSSSPILQEGVRPDGITTDPYSTYQGSVYLKGDSGGEEIEVYLYDYTHTFKGTSVFVTLSATEWVRVDCNIDTIVTSGDEVRLYIIEKTAGSAITFYADGFQIEQQDDVPTSWVDGTRAVNGTIQYSTLQESSFDLTINLWVRISSQAIGGYRYLVNTTIGDGSKKIELYLNPSDYLVFFTADNQGGNENFIIYSSPWDDDWHMVTATIRSNPLTGISSKQLYIDGVSVGSATPGGLPSPIDINSLDIGNQGGSNIATGILIEDVSVLPFSVDGTVSLIWFSMGTVMPDLPNVYVDGDVIPDDEFTVQSVGTINGITKTRATADGTWANNLEVIKFTLEEV